MADSHSHGPGRGGPGAVPLMARVSDDMRRWLVFGGLGLGWLVIVIGTVSWLFPADTTSEHRPILAALPPLEPLSRTSTVVAPAAIALSAVRTAIEASAPRSATGRKELTLVGVVSGGELSWTIDRGPLALAGRAEGLAITSPLTGAFRANGQIGTGQTSAGGQGGSLGAALGAVGNAVGGLGRQLPGGVFDQRADLRGTVNLSSRPRLTPAWRIEPNLVANVAINDVSLPIAGLRLNVAREVKPFVDNAVAEQMGVLENRVRADPFLEQAARREWAGICRAVPLGTGGSGLPTLWLEVRPTRAFAAQPRVDAAAVHLAFGVEAETRIVAGETKPVCPFPARLDLVPAPQQGSVAIGVPIDMPFTEVNRILDGQLAGKTFGADAGGTVAVTVKRATINASGDRLLISLRVAARTQSVFSFGAEATVHVWGRPALDTKAQVLRLTDLALDVESESAFGLLGAAARSAVPYLLPSLREQAQIDLKPFAADARRKIDAAVAEFRKRQDGVRLEAEITDLRLVGVAFDSTTLRVVAEADGSVRVAVATLPVP